MRSTLDIAIQTFEQTRWRPLTMSPRPLPMHTSVTSPLRIEVETAAYISSDNIESFPINGEDKKLGESGISHKESCLHPSVDLTTSVC